MSAERSIRDHQREASAVSTAFSDELERRRLLRDGWTKACLASEKKYGRRVARLYPLIGRQNGVKTPHGPGTLLQAFEDRRGQPGVMVLHLRPRSWIWEKGRKRPAADFVRVEDVEPYTPGVKR